MTTHAATGLFHSSTRTALTVNLQADGRRVQTMETSKLEMIWQPDGLAIRCKTSRVEVPAVRRTRAVRRD